MKLSPENRRKAGEVGTFAYYDNDVEIRRRAPRRLA
jgi:hypothetical protein